MNHDDLLTRARTQYQAIRYEGPPVRMPEPAARSFAWHWFIPVTAVLLVAVSVALWQPGVESDHINLTDSTFGENPDPALDPYGALKHSRMTVSSWGSGFGSTDAETGSTGFPGRISMPVAPGRASGFSQPDGKPLS